MALDHDWAPAWRIAAAIKSGDTSARAAVEAGLAMNPGFTIRRMCAAKSSDNSTYLIGQERLCEGMRLAGVPEG